MLKYTSAKKKEKNPLWTLVTLQYLCSYIKKWEKNYHTCSLTCSRGWQKGHKIGNIARGCEQVYLLRSTCSTVVLRIVSTNTSCSPSSSNTACIFQKCHFKKEEHCTDKTTKIELCNRFHDQQSSGKKIIA